eukprot:TRINITY_DN3071_c0_g1_i2.p1 TRINITY_DN3071_c0_g1~~TRINITY_DN3071_c0_g1_i2.p1  ORF type:complete len:121 (+),score=18.16 TRINITY_DN3071_c0_g1_i2:94-456(+)
MTPFYYNKADIIIMVYDSTDWKSYEKAKRWIEDVKKQTQTAILALVGSKSDLTQQRRVPFLEAETLASDHGIMLLECSAKTGENISNLFTVLCTNFYHTSPSVSVAAHSAPVSRFFRSTK